MYLFELPGKDRGFLLPKKWILPVARFVVIYELFRFLVYWNSFIGQFVHSVGEQGIKGVFVILDRFIREHENLV